MEIENLIGKYIYNNSLNIGGYPMVDILQKEIDRPLPLAQTSWSSKVTRQTYMC